MREGDVIGGRFRLLHLLGEGAMGSVWAAERRDGARVAVKLIAPELAAEPTARERFAREAALAARIDSAHVVRVIEHDATGPYLVMELLEGESLEARLEREEMLSLGAVAAIVEQTAQALARAHELGVVHRDIKPANLFLREGEAIFVKVLDFGIAKGSQAGIGLETATGVMMGTPLYMSPEQFLSTRDVDGQSDLWSLAVVAYRALTGFDAFDAETIGGIYVAISEGRFVPATARRSELPAGIDAWFERALAREPAKRFATAREMAAALSALVERIVVLEPRRARRPVVWGALAATLAGCAFASWDAQPAFAARGEPVARVEPLAAARMPRRERVAEEPRRLLSKPAPSQGISRASPRRVAPARTDYGF
jgi:serine/threonine protein kinase